MNVQDIVTRVRRSFGDEAAVQVTNEDVIRWINDGQVEIIKHNENALQTSDFIDLVANQSTYALPTDYLMLRSIRYKYTDMLSYSALKYLSMQQFDESIDGWDGTAYNSSSPRFYTINEGNLILFPTPDRDAVDGLKLLYNKKPIDVVALSDNLSLPLIYHNTIVNYCMWQASLLDEDHEPGLMYRANFDNDLGVLQNKEDKEATSTYPVITVLDFDQ